MAFERSPSVELHLPDHVLFGAVVPEQQFLLGSLGFLTGAVAGHEGLIGLEVVDAGAIEGIVERRTEADAQVHAGLTRRGVDAVSDNTLDVS